MKYCALKPGEITKPSVYFADCDLSAQERLGIISFELTQKFKALALLNESVVIATSHIFESSLTISSLFELKELLQSGIIIPALRSECKSFEDFLKIRRDEIIKTIFATRKVPKKYKRRMEDVLETKLNFLEENTRYVVSWKMPSTAREFKESLLNDLKNPNSSLRKQLNLDKIIVNDLIRKIECQDYLSRNRVHEIISSLKPSKRRRLYDHINIHYYMAGSHAVNSDLASDYGVIRNLRNRAKEVFTFNPRLISKVPKYMRFDIFKEFMQVLQIPIENLFELPPSAVIKIRKERITKKFRDKFNHIVEKVRVGEYDEIKDYISNDEISEIKREIREALEVAIDKEVKRDKHFYMIRKIMRAISYPCSALSLLGFFFPVPFPQIVGLPMTVYSVVDPFIEKLWNLMGGVEFIAFGLKIGIPRKVKWRFE